MGLIYIVETKVNHLHITEKGGLCELPTDIKFKKEFKENPTIHARKSAFNHLQNIEEVIKEGEKAISGSEVEDWWHNLEDSDRTGSKVVLSTITLKYSIEDVEDEQIEESFKLYFDELNALIFTTDMDYDEHEKCLGGLKNELKLYKALNIDTNGYETIFKLQNLEGFTEEYQILQIPSTWERDEKSLEKFGEEAETDEELDEKAKEILKLVREGEGKQVEFKSTLRYNLKTKVVDKKLEYAVLKTIAAFLNSEGGILLVGVSDNKTFLGLEEDFETFSKKSDPKDAFKLHLDNLIKEKIGLQSGTRISGGNFVEIEGFEIFSITVKKSDFPVFLKSEKKDYEFYTRGFASSTSHNIKEAYQYIVQHWGFKKD